MENQSIGGRSAKITNLQKNIRRELIVKNTFDLAAWELIEEAGINTDVPIREGFILTLAVDANDTVLKSLSVRNNATSATSPSPK